MNPAVMMIIEATEVATKTSGTIIQDLTCISALLICSGEFLKGGPYQLCA